jgi:hypothetical protein
MALGDLGPHLSSSHALVKALKSSIDSRTKLRLAAKALSDSSLYLPHRNQILQDWILDSWLRHSNTIFDVEYHVMLISLPSLTSVDLAPYVLASLKVLADNFPSSAFTTSMRTLYAADPQPVKAEIWVESLRLLLARTKASKPKGIEHIWTFLLHDWAPDASDEKKVCSGRSSLATLTCSLL